MVNEKIDKKTVVLSTFKNTNIEQQKKQQTKHQKLMGIIDEARELPTTFGCKNMQDIVTDEMDKLNSHLTVAKHILTTLKNTDIDSLHNQI